MSEKSIDVDAYVKLVRTADALHGEVSRGLAAEGITPSQFSAMKALRFHGTMPQKDVAIFMLKTAGNVTLVLDNLEKQGLITRDRRPDDRRVMLVSLSQAGEKLFDRLYDPHIGRIKAAMSGLDSAGLTSLLGLLQELHPTVNSPVCQPEADTKSEKTGSKG